MQFTISSRYNQFIKDNLVLEEFNQRHSIDIFCPNCGKSIRVTEWTTDIVCSCGKKLDALEILFESFFSNPQHSSWFSYRIASCFHPE